MKRRQFLKAAVSVAIPVTPAAAVAAPAPIKKKGKAVKIAWFDVPDIKPEDIEVESVWLGPYARYPDNRFDITYEGYAARIAISAYKKETNCRVLEWSGLGNMPPSLFSKYHFENDTRPKIPNVPVDNLTKEHVQQIGAVVFFYLYCEELIESAKEKTEAAMRRRFRDGKPFNLGLRERSDGEEV